MSDVTYYPPPEADGGWRSLVAVNETPTDAEKARTLETTGLDWDRLCEAWTYGAGFGTPNSLLVIRHGWIAGEWHDYTDPRGIASCMKSITGLAMAKVFDLSDAGKLPVRIGVDDEAWQYLPPEWAEAEPERRKIRLRDMLTMTSGLVPLDSGYDELYYRRMMEQTVEAAPGTLWAYSSGPVDWLSLVIEKVTGKTLGDFFEEEIHAPIGVAPIRWGMFGSHVGGSGGPQGGARYSTRELARVGYLVLHNGVWGDDRRQVVTADRLKRMTRHAPFLDKTTRRNPNFAFEPGSNNYYGHLWWTNCTGQGLGEAAPRDAVYMSGWGKQQCVVAPSLDMVIVRLGANRELNAQPKFYHELWARLMNAVKDE